MEILLVEDDIELCSAIKVLLEKDDYNITICHNGNDGKKYIFQNRFDLIILDRMMPGIDGLTLLFEMRSNNISTPVIMLTAMGDITDKVDGLDMGADDYIVKPFEIREFLARVRAVIRRPMLLDEKHILKFAGISLNTQDLILSGEKGECSLSKKETELLALFLSRPNQTLKRDFLFAGVWGMESEVEYASLDSYVHFLRRRIKSVSDKVAVTTVRGIGYKLEEIS